MVDRHFTVHPAPGGFSLTCFDSGCPMFQGFYESFALPVPFPDAHGGGSFRDAGMAGAVLDGRCFVETGLIP